MAVQKNFVVKNGIEVRENLIFADTNQNKVGIGTTIAPEKLRVNGGIGATSLVLTGVGTIPTLQSTNGTITTLNSTTGSITTISGTTLGYNTGYIASGVVTSLSGSNLNYSGISTLGNVKISSGIITATVGNVTYYGDGSNLSLAGNPDLSSSTGIGIQTGGTLVGYGATLIEFRGSGVTTGFYSSSTGIATIFFEAPGAVAQDLNNVLGVGNTTPLGMSVGVLTASSFVKSGGTSSQFLKADGSIDSNTYLTSYTETQTLNNVLTLGNTSSLGMNVGVVTATSFVGPLTGTATSTTNIPNLTGDVTSNNTTTTLATVNSNVGTFGDGGAIPSITVNAKGLITGVSTSAIVSGITITDDTSTNATRYLTFTSSTSGSVSGQNVSSTKLTFNPSTGTLTATDLNSSSDESLKENIETVEEALDKINNLRGVKFNWKEDGRVSYGVIAQELEQVLPELVANTDPKTVNYNGIIGVLIEAVKELSDKVDELERRSS